MFSFSRSIYTILCLAFYPLLPTFTHSKPSHTDTIIKALLNHPMRMNGRRKWVLAHSELKATNHWGKRRRKFRLELSLT